jgi:hypothetical protein
MNSTQTSEYETPQESAAQAVEPGAADPPETSAVPEGSYYREVFDPAQHHEEIARLAYALWEERGCTDGAHEEDWFRAEQQLRAQLSGRYGS